MRVLMDTNILQEIMGEISKELIWANVGVMGFNRKGVLSKIFFKNKLGGVSTSCLPPRGKRRVDVMISLVMVSGWILGGF